MVRATPLALAQAHAQVGPFPAGALEREDLGVPLVDAAELYLLKFVEASGGGDYLGHRFPLAVGCLTFLPPVRVQERGIF